MLGHGTDIYTIMIFFQAPGEIAPRSPLWQQQTLQAAALGHSGFRCAAAPRRSGGRDAAAAVRDQSQSGQEDNMYLRTYLFHLT